MRRLMLLTLALSLSLGLMAAPVSASHTKASMDKLTVKITDTGTLWGHVTVSWKAGGKTVSKTCAKATCKWSLAAGSKLTFKEKPTDSTTWPFKDWTIQKKGKKSKTVMGTSAKLTLGGTYTVTSVYVFA